MARWEPPPSSSAGRGIPLGLAPRVGASRSLEVVTTQIRPGYLRKNGVPFSENAVVTEYYDLFGEPKGGDWFVVTTIVRDPQYLGEPWITTSHFKKEPDASKWTSNARVRRRSARTDLRRTRVEDDRPRADDAGADQRRGEPEG